VLTTAKIVTNPTANFAPKVTGGDGVGIGAAKEKKQVLLYQPAALVELTGLHENGNFASCQ